jgi:Na+-transporting NADH:ubiquinone oxidoreductase subunit NqrC
MNSNKSRYLKNYFKHNGLVLVCELLIVLLLSLVCSLLLKGKPLWLAPVMAVAAYLLAELRFMMAYIAKCVKRDRMLEEQARAAAEEAEDDIPEGDAEEEFAPAEDEEEYAAEDDEAVYDEEGEYEEAVEYDEESEYAEEQEYEEEYEEYEYEGEAEDEVSEVTDADFDAEDEDIDTFKK